MAILHIIISIAKNKYKEKVFFISRSLIINYNKIIKINYLV